MKPEIYINMQLASDEAVNRAHEDTDKYSITPTSFRARSYFSDIDELQNQDVEDEKEESTVANCKWYTDEYSNYTQSVKRFGINNLTVDDLNAIDSNFEVSEVEPVADDASTVFSINTAWRNLRDTEALCHPIELSLMRRAVDHLLHSECNVVLLDIFVRDDNGAIRQILGKSNLEIHTVLLYKNPQAEDGKMQLTVIDPSNSKFSYHLSQWGRLLQYDDNDADVVVEAFLKGKNGLKIYKPSKPPGPSDDQYRDCIDIAVKLAFGLSSYDEHIDVAAIKELPIVKAISNIPAIDDAVFYSGRKDKDITVRVKQSSDMNIVEEFSRIMQLTKEVMNAADKFDIEEVVPDLKKILQTVDYHQKNLFDELMKYNHQCIYTIDTASVKLVGDLRSMEKALCNEQKED